nr:retrovirus-related Pol polyprotein from transposon TNT 1-94 [Tanacetum cinerariifolium]
MDESILWDQKCKSSIKLFKIKSSVDMIFDGVERCKETIAHRTYSSYLDPFIQNTIEENFSQAIRRINAGLEKFHVCLNEEMVADLKYFNYLELEVDSLRSQLETQKTQFLNEIDRLSREYCYADHMNAILGVYTELDEVTNLQCDYLELLEKCECLEKELLKSKMMSKSFEALQKHAINLEIDLQQCQKKIKNDKSFKVNQSKEFCKEREQYFEIQDLKAQLQDKGIVISELKKLIEKLKGKSVNTKFEKSSVIRQPNAFKIQRPSILGKPTIFSNSLERNDFSKPHLKSNLMRDRVMRNNSQGKKQDVEDHRRSVKFFMNKTSVTACNDSLKAKTLNVNFVCATCGKCMLKEKHDMRVLKSVNDVNSRTKMPIVVPVSTREPKCTVKQSVAKPMRKTIDSESNQKPRNTLRNIYECVSKACSWWYPKFTPSGYKWKPKSEKENVNPNVRYKWKPKFGKENVNPNTSMPLGSVSKNANILEHMTSRFSWHGLVFDHSSRHNCPNPICLMAKASSSQAWLWHRRLSHLNFNTINLLSKNDIVVGLPKLKFVKDHLCSSCELGKAKRSKRRLQLLHMDLCGPMRVASINGKRYVLVIVDDYSRYTWTYFLRSKDETPKVLINFLRLGQRGLQAQVRIVRTDKGTEFVNQNLYAYFAAEGIHHQTSVARTPEQNSSMVLEHDNLSPAIQRQENVPQADRIVTTSNELDLL